MAIKKPLVITSGQIERLQSGDSISSTPVFSATNNNAGSIVIGRAVYTDAGDGVDLAQADAVGTACVIGLVASSSIAAAATGEIRTDGTLTATTGEWDVVTGDSGGLTPGSKYFLDASTAGGLTTTAPSADTQFVTNVGIALSTTEMKILIRYPIKL